MTSHCLQRSLVILALASCAVAQNASTDRVCTDLSGKFRLRCPNQSPAAPAASGTPSSADSTTLTRFDSPAASAPRPATVSDVSMSSAAVDSPLPAARAVQPAPRHSSLERSIPRNFVEDQKNFWTSPRNLRVQDTRWLVPLVGAMTAVALSDGAIERKLPTSPSLISRSKSFSDYGAAAYAGGIGGAYLLSLASHNDHLQETALLSGEAALNSLLITEGIKYIAGRQRPLEGDGTGDFRRRGSSFPSMHSAGAWSIASVIAREYPGPLTQFLAYGSAAAISAARVTGRQHFASDALVGSAIGWFVGRQVYNAHHDQSEEALYGTFEHEKGPRDPSFMGSTYVPLDSWIYPAINRLSALGYVQNAFSGSRPWTRMECARLLSEASVPSEMDGAAGAFADLLYERLSKEFEFETRRLSGDPNLTAEIESVYVRFTGISGKPLTDGYHFGQTLVNDFGRPYQQGFNAITGISGRASAGPLAFYVRGEYQHAPAAPGYSQSVQDAVQYADAKPRIAASPFIPSVDRLQLLDAYVAFNIADMQASFGKQSLTLGPTQDPFLSGTNADPVLMFRLSQTHPTKLPSIFGILGPIKSEFWFGRLIGHHFVNKQDNNVLGDVVYSLGSSLSRQPFVDGVKVSFQPTANLQFGVGKTALFGGPNFPVTLDTFYRSAFIPTNAAGVGHDPGDRRSTFDFSYRVPGLRNWLVLYNESFVEDEISPIGYPRRAAQNQGLYMPQLPYLPKLDLRVEGGYTNLPGLLEPLGGGFFYWNTRYLDGYTNAGNVIGNATLGRQGIGYRALTTYSFAADKTIQVGFRSNQVDRMFAGGGNYKDFSVRSDWSFTSALSLTSLLQYERWNFPLLSPGGSQANFTASFQFTYWPHWKLGE